MSDTPRQNERRLHPRYSLKGEIDLGAGKDGAAVLRDLSRSGLSCTSPVAFDDMTVLEISIPLPFPEGPRALTVGGAVVRCEALPDGDGYTVAIFFTQIDETAGKVLDDFLALQSA